MDSTLKKKLRAISLSLRHVLELDGDKPGDLHLRLNELGVWPDRPARPIDELALTDEDRIGRSTVDAFLAYREEAGVSQKTAFREFVRESAYSWANRLFALRCMEARNLIDPVILQQQIYGGRSLVHHRFSRENPAACTGDDDGLFAVLALEFSRRAVELPAVFDPHAPAITLRPSVSALKRCIQLLSGSAADSELSDALFQAPDALGWAYQFWNAEEKDRVFERVRTEKGAKIEGADIIPATQLYTEPYMVKFLVQNSLGALWVGMYPDSALAAQWEYYVHDADRTPPVQPDPPPFDVKHSHKPSPDPWTRPNPHLGIEPDIIAYARTLTVRVPTPEDGRFVDLRNQLLDAANRSSVQQLLDLYKRVCEAWDREWPSRRPKLQKRAEQIMFLDPACGSGHFLLEAFDLLFAMYREKNPDQAPEDICASILNNNLFGVDIDARAIQIGYASLWMHAVERAPKLRADSITHLIDHLVAANLALPRERGHLEAFLEKHPEDAPLAPALEIVFQGLADADQLGTLLKIEEPLDEALHRLKNEDDRSKAHLLRQSQGKLDFVSEQYSLEELRPKRDYISWKRDVLNRLREHFRQEATVSDPVQGFFGRDARQAVALVEILGNRFDVVAANPPWMGSNNMSARCYSYLERFYPSGKRDIYAAFILRNRDLCRADGYVAMVTQQSWLFLRSFAQLRGRLPGKNSTSSADLLQLTRVECLAHLGRYAFSELGNAVIQPILFVLRIIPIDESHAVYAIRLKAPRPADEQAHRLKTASNDRCDPSVYQPRQIQLYSLPESALIYWLPSSYLNLTISRKRDETELFISEGIGTRDQGRFLRFSWEVPSHTERFLPYSKGGGHSRWFGLENYAVEWFLSGARVKAYLVRKHPPDKLTLLIQHEYLYGGECLTYSAVAQGSMNARINGTRLFSGSGPGVFWKGAGDIRAVLAILNTRLTSFLLRGLTAGSIAFCRAYVEKLPLTSDRVVDFEQRFGLADIDELVRLKRGLVQQRLTEDSYSAPPRQALSSFKEHLNRLVFAQMRTAAKILLLEGQNEHRVFEFFEIPAKDVERTIAETGVPCSWLPSSTASPSGAQSAAVGEIESVIPVAGEIALKQRLRALYRAGYGSVEANEPVEDEEVTDDDELEVESGAAVPIPAETFLEELSQKLHVHPETVLRWLEEMRDAEGLTSVPELVRLAEDYLSDVILRLLLGHKWPTNRGLEAALLKQVEATGVIPLNGASPSKPMLSRVTDHLAHAFESNAVHEFEELVGTSLSRWLEREFFPLHLRQFRNRPIAWQIQTQPAGRSETPILSVLIYYHRLGGALPSLRSGYAAPMRASFDSELKTLERLTSLTGDQRVRKERLKIWIEELKAFEDILAKIEEQGFGVERLRYFAISDAMHSMARRWLGRLRDQIQADPLSGWKESATADGFPPELPKWIVDAVDRVVRQCAELSPAPPPVETPNELLTPVALVECFKGQTARMVGGSLSAVCRDWQDQFDKAIVRPLREQVKAFDDEIKGLLDTIENVVHRKHLKAEIKRLKKTITDITAQSKGLATQIQEWRYPEAEQWLAWLADQPLFDEISSLDGRRPPPTTVAEFVAQESQYQPDVNDGVRVNIAPLQRAGVLGRDVLAAKDIDKAVADRAEWRADERRWVRQGILPQPGWWALKRAESEPAK